VHSSCTERPTYTGARAFPFVPPFAGPIMGHHPHPEPHGFCHSCCHPRSHCMCHRRECRKEAKELVVNSDTATTTDTTGAATGALNLLKAKAESLATNLGTLEGATINRKGVVAGTAFIGGGCCVHLSVEYIANDPTKGSAVEILVEDSEGTFLGWGRLEPAGTPYRIKEGIVTTKPGAKLIVAVINATARVRWCEVFSC
jgi:hypothetical protein